MAIDDWQHYNSEQYRVHIPRVNYSRFVSLQVAARASNSMLQDTPNQMTDNDTKNLEIM